ncbi:MAG: NAD(P)-dependent oxidoreductase [Proteobacteria bacterium]|nr:NAD(P)-dependent oxidoreductase [Pseudomonadota bacterium]
MKIGFIGLGYLGKTIARRLISEGVELIVWNRTKGKASDLDAEIADTPAELIAQVDLLFLNLFDSNAVKSVVFGNDGLTQANVSEKIIIDTTTNHFEDVLYIHETLREYGAYYLEAPVLGSVVPASQGNLTVLVSGDHDAFDKARPYIEKIGKTIFYLEKPSLATKMKLINNLLLGVFMATIAEATVFGEIAGVDRETALNIFSAGILI